MSTNAVQAEPTPVSRISPQAESVTAEQAVARSESRIENQATTQPELTSTGQIETQPNTLAARQIDPQADSVFRQMSEVLDDAKTFRFRIKATMDRPVQTGQLAQFHRVSNIVVARPDKLHAETNSDEGRWTAWHDGNTLTLLDRDQNVYATETVPNRIGEMLDYLVDTYGLIMPMADLLAEQPYDTLLANVDSGQYLGLHSVQDTPCHHLLFHQPNIDWQIWIESSPKLLPRKLLITYTQDMDQPQYVAMIDSWELTLTVAADAFRFVPPAGAESVSISDLIAHEQGGQP